MNAPLITNVGRRVALTDAGLVLSEHAETVLLIASMAIQLADSIDFEGQEIALRSLAFDRETIECLTRHPKATVVALAEGLQASLGDSTTHCTTLNSVG